MSSYRKIKGFADLFPPDSTDFLFLEQTAREVFFPYGYKEIRIPVVEKTELFCRSIGEETDVVLKEMYTFPDRKGRSLTLRPEATASIMRAYIEAKLHSREQISKLFTFGPMFRYERPQKGRMRQFHQLDVECIGPSEPHVDAEIILMLTEYLSRLGLPNLNVELNTLGCRECRPYYHQALGDFFASLDHDSMCDDCRRRMTSNPLRVLDCKVPTCKEQLTGAPVIGDHVCADCAEHFSEVRKTMDTLGIPYELNPRLVRGLDYYMRTTFEITSGDIGAQSAVAGGGRYDGLIQQLGGPDISGIGFAIGMERLALLLPEREEQKPDFHIVVLDPKGLAPAMDLARKLRYQGLTGTSSFSVKSMKSQMRQAQKLMASACLILGGDELANNEIVIKSMATSEQTTCSLDAISDIVTTIKPT